MNVSPKTIQIFLPGGDPRGIRVAEITTRIVQVIEVPRSLLGDFLAMSESHQVAVYYLFGQDDDGEGKTVYIGQTGDLQKRLSQHHKEKDFWQRALVLVSRTNSLTQTHALFLEWMCIQEAKRAARYSTENGNGGTKPHTPAPLAADCMEIYDTGRTLLATLGYPLFEPLAQQVGPQSETEYFFCTAAGTDARCQFTSEGVVVFSGSKARVAVAENFKTKPLFNRRQSLIKAGILTLDGKHYEFTQDYLFSSPSSAAAVIVGNSQNGWTTWKNKEGKTLKEVKRGTPP